MKLTQFRSAERLVVRAQGRLDVTWADYFKDTLLEYIRGGEHRILLDAAEIEYLSSLGIRALMVVYKELSAVDGSFHIVHAYGMVQETLMASGLQIWLSDEVLGDEESASAALPQTAVEFFELDADATLRLESVAAWTPWQPVQQEKAALLSFGENSIGLGIGAAAGSAESLRDHLGEFMAVNGQVALHAPDEQARPDCLLLENRFVPELHCIQALKLTGSMAQLMRFRISEEIPAYLLSELIGQAAAQLRDCDAFAVVIAGEIEGLVGARLIQSPGRLSGGNESEFPALKERISYCGERVFARELAVISGVIRRRDSAVQSGLCPLNDQFSAHLHAAVFPYQLLPNGVLDLTDTMQRIFNGSPPKSVMHLVHDTRSGNGLGESALYSGACWFAPINESEVKS